MKIHSGTPQQCTESLCAACEIEIERDEDGRPVRFTDDIGRVLEVDPDEGDVAVHLTLQGWSNARLSGG